MGVKICAQIKLRGVPGLGYPLDQHTWGYLGLYCMSRLSLPYICVILSQTIKLKRYCLSFFSSEFVYEFLFLRFPKAQQLT